MLFRIFYTLIFIVSLWSAELSLMDVETIAINFLNQRENTIENYTIESIQAFNVIDSSINMYIAYLNPIGFIILSGEDRTIPILGYSYHSEININELPRQLEAILISYQEGIQHVVDNNIMQDDKTIDLLEQYLNNSDFINRNNREVSPMITADWNQGGGWNNFCPGNSVVGCVAVAMGQVMNYWEYPTQGDGYSQYYSIDYGVIGVNFEDYTYDFSNMYDDYPTEDSQLLLFHAGVAVHMNYTPWASGASVCWEGPSAQNALDEHFGYNDDITCEVKINYTDEQWRSLIKDQLDRGWPMVYRGYSEDAGHAWNIDGYQNDYYHCNWGWGGYANGYFYFDNLNAGGYNFIESQAALLNIVPEIFNNPTALFDFEKNDLTVEFYDLSQAVNQDEIVLWVWDFGDGNTSFDLYPIHTYEDYDSYNVTLTVMSEYGLYSEPHIELIDILNLLGDINADSLIDVLDVVLLVDFILNNDNINQNFDIYDLNEDLQIDVLDIILLIQIIIN